MNINDPVTLFTGKRGIVAALLPDPHGHGHDRVQVKVTCDIVSDGGTLPGVGGDGRRDLGAAHGL